MLSSHGPVRESNLSISVFSDNSPLFTESHYSASISENVKIGTTVLVVEASDADIGINSRITYSLNNESHWHFTIDNATGAIVTAGYVLSLWLSPSRLYALKFCIYVTNLKL